MYTILDRINQYSSLRVVWSLGASYASDAPCFSPQKLPLIHSIWIFFSDRQSVCSKRQTSVLEAEQLVFESGIFP